VALGLVLSWGWLTGCSTDSDPRPLPLVGGAGAGAGGPGLTSEGGLAGSAGVSEGGASGSSAGGLAMSGGAGNPPGGSAGQAPIGGGGAAPTTPAKTDGTPILYVGGGFYSTPSAVYAFRFDQDTGELTPIQKELSTAVAPTALAVDPTRRRLYATIENVPGQVMAFRIAPGSGELETINTVSSGGDGSTHLSLDETGAWIFEGNYESGSVTVLATLSDGSAAQVTDSASFGDGAYAHAVRIDRTNRFVFVPTKGLDAVAQLTFDAKTGTLSPNTPASVAAEPGSKPRHIEIHPSNQWVYVIGEAGSSMTTYALDSALGTLTRVQDLSTLPAGAPGKNTGADVVADPTGKFLYGSNRGHDSIVMYAIDQGTGKLTLIGHQPSGGSTPQSVTIDASGRFLVVTNKGSHRVSVFEIDASTGKLSAFGPGVSVDTPSWAGLVYVPQ
jgi:6-phosphogluconolactonase